MKPFLLFFVLLWMTGCSDNKTSTTPERTNNAEEKKPGNKNSDVAQGDGIVGEWEMTGFVSDTNDNLQVDEEERKTLKTPGFQDYMKLNSDGSGLFTVAKMEGRYETTESNGKKSLTWFDEGNGRHRVGTIIAVSKEELHIKEPGGNGLFIWKRI